MKQLLIVLLLPLGGCASMHPNRADALAATAIITPVRQQRPVFVNPGQGYLVTRIDSLKSVYLIYARRSDTLFKIVSDKALVPNCRKLQIGEHYKLQLRSLLYTDLTPTEQAHSIPGLKPFDTHHMNGLDYDGKGLVVVLEGDSIRDLHYAKNLIGWCLQ